MNDGRWYTTRCSMLDRKKQEHSLENAFKRISSFMREMSKKKKDYRKEDEGKKEIRREKTSHFTFFNNKAYKIKMNKKKKS
jgi:hypothetical protein